MEKVRHRRWPWPKYRETTYWRRVMTSSVRWKIRLCFKWSTEKEKKHIQRCTHASQQSSSTFDRKNWPMYVPTIYLAFLRNDKTSISSFWCLLFRFRVREALQWDNLLVKYVSIWFDSMKKAIFSLHQNKCAREEESTFVQSTGVLMRMNKWCVTGRKNELFSSGRQKKE
jgi:hypothetical protein